MVEWSCGFSTYLWGIMEERGHSWSRTGRRASGLRYKRTEPTERIALVASFPQETHVVQTSNPEQVTGITRGGEAGWVSGPGLAGAPLWYPVTGNPYSVIHRMRTATAPTLAATAAGHVMGTRLGHLPEVGRQLAKPLATMPRSAPVAARSIGPKLRRHWHPTCDLRQESGPTNMERLRLPPRGRRWPAPPGTLSGASLGDRSLPQSLTLRDGTRGSIRWRSRSSGARRLDSGPYF